MAQPQFHCCVQGLHTGRTDVKTTAMGPPHSVYELILAHDREVETFTQGSG
jgi:hypothetical protein